MFCVQEKESHVEPFRNSEKDPLTTQSESSDDEPDPKRMKYNRPELNLQMYQLSSFNTPKSLSIYPSTPTSTLPKFVNNPLNLANPLAFATSNLQTNIVKNLHSRYSLPAKLTITPVTKTVTDSGEVVRYKKNGEIAKKRGPPKGYKRKPKDLSQSFSNGALLQAQNTILTSLLAATNTSLTTVSPAPPAEPVPEVKLPPGTELVELLLDPEDWFPSEPYRMVFSRKKNPKWKNFPYRCEHCFKGYRVLSTLVSHCGARHGSPPRSLALPCPCCPHVSLRRKHHKKHLETHQGKRHRIFCVYCLPADTDGPYTKEAIKYPFESYPHYWYASEESLRLHKKRKHPYAAMFNYNWFCTWGEGTPNS
ncbi:uncharacterized protein LOC116776958 [Danaus plexippus]|uniref:Uncharacterized protein n=1 Tax=Danaus plexippus plexippus TaxID=278856 RepID=A0A212F102_DANPL|nr:uncharacterized protein LOC116776958 [Danaus plexippus]OWR47425.1 hypothetical protein KGM_214979 [Danaus plexippus plexippus]